MNYVKDFCRLALVMLVTLTTAGMASADPIVKLTGIGSIELMSDGIGQIAFSWRDSVQFSDSDDRVFNTGRFIKSRPAGAVSRTKTISDGTSNIIAILIG